MMAGLMAAEIQTRREGNVLRFEEMLAEREGIAAELADIGVQIKRTFRLDGDVEAQLAQRRQKVIAATTEFGAALLENRDRRRLKTGQGRVLRHARRADVEVLRQFFQLADRCVR